MTTGLNNCPKCGERGEFLKKEVSEIFTKKAIQVLGGPRYRAQSELSDVPSLSTRKERADDYALEAGNQTFQVKKASYVSYCAKCNMVF